MDNGSSSYSRFLSGDKDAIDEIIKEYKDGLVYYLYSITRDMQLAEEAAIDTFVKLYVDKPRFKGSGAFKTWIYTIGRNKAYDSVRKLSKLSCTPLEEAYYISDGNDIEKKVDKDEMRADLRRIVSKLKPEYSQAICLVFFENFTNDEAAKIMNKSNKQVRDLLYRAKQILKKELTKEGAVYYGL
ncbi:MAG: RNA polymerase sigma factor [Ruminococcus sp.]|nr:RNA polymerase sigma factor [Ruminococcus sp.]HRR75759.1 RNA polymerase sigma factor [Ruminococcus sp.]